MTLASHGKTQSEQTPDRVCTPTVASLGVQVHLVPVDVDRESKLARLIASGETLRLEWESLFQQLVELLNNDVQSVQDSDTSSCSPDL
jgi:hypothetical protein